MRHLVRADNDRVNEFLAQSKHGVFSDQGIFRENNVKNDFHGLILYSKFSSHICPKNSG